MSDTKLILNFVIDNSASMKGDKFTKLKDAILEFDNKIKSTSLSDKIEYSITGFKGFDSILLKEFDQQLEINKIQAAGLPFMNDAIKKGIGNLMNRIDVLNKSSIDTFKPWTILLINGENYDVIDESVSLILDVMKAGKMTYFPFVLTDCEFDRSLLNLRKIKQFTIIRDEKYDCLFNWVFDMAKMRAEKPKSEPISISPNAFEGWTIK